MSPPDQLYLRVLDGFTDVVRRVPQDRWDSASPCTEWNARQLTGHVIDAQHQVIALLSERMAKEPVTDLARLDALAGTDVSTAWHAVDTAIRDTLATVDLSAQVTTPRGAMSGAEVLTMVVIEPLVHTWDLATATGQAVWLDGEAVEVTLPEVERLGDQLAATGMYAAAHPLPATASVQDRLLAALGRKPR